MKKLLLLLGLLIALPAVATDFTYEYEGQTLNYMILDEGEMTCMVVPTAVSGSLTIPERVSYAGNDYKVTTLCYTAFTNCTELTSITLPGTLTSIGNQAFRGCTGLKEVTLPEGLTELGQSVFNSCTGLKNVYFPTTLTSIGDQCFQNCDSLLSVVFQEGLTKIPYQAFFGCRQLQELILPNSLKAIGNGAFYYCDMLSTVTFPAGLTELGAFAFQYCKRLRWIYTFNPEPQEITYLTFHEIPSVAEIFVPIESVEKFRETEFWNEFEIRGMEPMDITLSASDLMIAPEESLQLTAEITKGDGVTVRSQSWRSSDSAVVSVDNDGNLIGVSEGKAVITFSLIDSYGALHMLTCNVVVSAEASIVPTSADSNGTIDFTAPYKIYTLAGCVAGETLSDLLPGVYVVRQGSVAQKIVIR